MLLGLALGARVSAILQERSCGVALCPGEMTAHGFRSIASTLLNEQAWNPDLIELQLAHKERNKVRAAYNRAQRFVERRQMMQAWADYHDGLKNVHVPDLRMSTTSEFRHDWNTSLSNTAVITIHEHSGATRLIAWVRIGTLLSDNR
jgi:hypothetical protein